MSKKINPTSIGLFVAGAIVILLAGLIVLGTGKLFETRGKFVVYFQASANGLDEGSEVVLGGVKVGQVVSMRVQFDPVTKAKVIPVVIELSADRLAALGAEMNYSKEELLSSEVMEKFVQEDGLRARLMTKSPLTGQLYVDLDFFVEDIESYSFPGEPVDGLTQIPSTKNEIQRVLESIAEGVHKLSAIDFGELVQSVEDLVTNVDSKVAELDFKGISERLNSSLDKADAAFADLQALTGDERIRKIIASIDETAVELKELIAGVKGEKFNEVLVEAAELMKSTREAMKKIDLAAANLAESTTPDGALTIRLSRALAGVEEVSKSIKELTDYLKRNPNSVLAGKKRP